MDISIIIPACNEEKNIEPLCFKLREALSKVKKDYEIIFIDDGSTDNTFNELYNVKIKNKKIKILRFNKNLGKTSALKAGFDHSKGKLIVTMDADLQDNPTIIPILLKEIEQGYDMVVVSRYLRNDPIIKIILGRIANFIRNKVTEEAIYDSVCPFKIFKKECLKNITLYKGFHRFLPTLFKMQGYKIQEIKLQNCPRKYGKSKYNIRNRLFEFLFGMLVVRWMEKNQIKYYKHLMKAD